MASSSLVEKSSTPPAGGPVGDFSVIIVKMTRAKLTFCGGAGTATGANFLFETADQKFLIDCGLFQGFAVAEAQNRESFPYDPQTITALLVTHAHLDHIGRIPKLVRAGFRGPIFSTPPTREMSELSLLDSLSVFEKEARHSGQTPLYAPADVTQALSQWQTINYREALSFGEVAVTAKDAGHILGSAMYELALGERKIVFTGDLGNSPAPLLPDTEPVTNADYLVLESVYGDRDHEDRQTRKEKLEDVIENTMRAGGTLVIPAFSI